jgi:hypothetical protein
MTSWHQMPAVSQPPSRGSWVLFIVPVLVAGVLYLLGHPTAAVIIALIGLSIGIGTHLSSAFKRLFERLALKLAELAGSLLSALLLLPFYMLIMAPIAAFRRAGGGDPLKLDIDPKALSYWEEHGPMSGRYDRPF